MIEFRICNIVISWEDTPVFATVRIWSPNCTERERFANDFARFLSDRFDTEVRWNHQGSLQGHYTIPATWK